MKSTIFISILFLSMSLACTKKSSISIDNTNTKTETVKIYGNCNMCKNTIEKAGNIKEIANVTWNKDTKMAVIVYDSTKTTQSEILQKIVLSGYDSENQFAPKAVYNDLPECCQYTRNPKNPDL